MLASAAAAELAGLDDPLLPLWLQALAAPDALRKAHRLDHVTASAVVLDLQWAARGRHLEGGGPAPRGTRRAGRRTGDGRGPARVGRLAEHEQASGLARGQHRPVAVEHERRAGAYGLRRRPGVAAQGGRGERGGQDLAAQGGP